MKHLAKVSLVACAAMFIFSNNADAQFGGLKKLAKTVNKTVESASKAVDNATKKVDEAKKTVESVEAVANDPAAAAASAATGTTATPAVPATAATPATTTTTNSAAVPAGINAMGFATYDPNAAKSKKQKELEENKTKMWEMNNYLAGQKVKATNIFPENNPVDAATIYEWAKNFKDKATIAKISAQVKDEEAFNDRKRKAGDLQKGRKIVDILFDNTDWQIRRDKYDVITGRYIGAIVVFELASGFTVVEEYNVSANYEGAGKYSDNLKIELRYLPGNSEYYGHIVYKQWMVTDWEHKK